eukprot:1161714-Pelagomonas_calceolata.AAC.4
MQVYWYVPRCDQVCDKLACGWVAQAGRDKLVLKGLQGTQQWPWPRGCVNHGLWQAGRPAQRPRLECSEHAICDLDLHLHSCLGHTAPGKGMEPQLLLQSKQTGWMLMHNCNRSIDQFVYAPRLTTRSNHECTNAQRTKEGGHRGGKAVCLHVCPQARKSPSLRIRKARTHGHRE